MTTLDPSREAFESLLSRARQLPEAAKERWKDGSYRFKFIEDAWQEFYSGWTAPAAPKQEGST